MLWQVILAAMLFLQPPGQSVYSQVVVTENAPAPCSNPYSLLCRAPRWNAERNGYTVAEDWRTGVERYALIARTLARVVDEGKWSTPKADLWRYALVAVYAESGFRRDVHEGVGEASRGDCDWTGPPGKRVRVKGSCKSWCLGQILLGRRGQTMTYDEKTRTFTKGWLGRELVGLDEEHTFRCLSTVVRYMDRAAGYCRTAMGLARDVRCVMGAYGGGNLPMKDARLLARAKTYNKLLGAPVSLDATVLATLGLAQEDDGSAVAVGSRASTPSRKSSAGSSSFPKSSLTFGATPSARVTPSTSVLYLSTTSGGVPGAASHRLPPITTSTRYSVQSSVLDIATILPRPRPKQREPQRHAKQAHAHGSISTSNPVSVADSSSSARNSSMNN